MLDFIINYGWAALVTALAGYLLGSISFSIIFTRVFAKMDIRDCGSGNAGATNVLRAVGARAAALTFVCDFIKCVAAVLIGSALPNTARILAAQAVYLGTCTRCTSVLRAARALPPRRR